MSISSKINWLLETDIFEENLPCLVEEIKRQGHNVKVLSYEPFQSGETYLDAFPQDSCTIFYGCLDFGAQVQREAQWVPGCIANFKAMECTSYYPHLSNFLLNNPYIMLPYGDVLKQERFLFDTLGNNNALFIRPNGGRKSFTGTVVYKETFQKDIERIGIYNIEPEHLVIVTEPRNILKEWRFVIVGGELVSGSLYKEDGELKTEPFKIISTDTGTHNGCGALLLCHDIAEKYSPDIAFTADIALLKNGAYELIEINSFSCSGLYECEVGPIVEQVSKVAQQEWESYQCVE